MCGITGIWNFDDNKIFPEHLHRFNDSLAHRGSDGSDIYIDENANLGLGHRRLSILDLSENGKQPMTYAQNRYWITYNGEVYNFIELKNELIAKGHIFKTNSDTEIVLAAYVEWGKDCFLKFNGMWAIAIWDSQEQTLLLSRDRFGIKPLHYLYIPDKIFAFSSETISFKYLKGYGREIDSSIISHTLNQVTDVEGLGYTIFKNIKQLLPGHFIEIKKTKSFQQKRWWNTLEHLKKVPLKYEDQVEEFKTIFIDSCKIRMRSDVPIASALSGGIDSSSVYCMLHHLMQNDFEKNRIPENWQTAFVAYFPGTSQDEKQFAKKVIEYTRGNVYYIEPDYKNIVSDLIESTVKFDAISSTPLLCATDVYKAMNQNGIKVSMDGHGVDEMLYGYPHLVLPAYQDAIRSGDSILAADIKDVYINLYPDKIQPAVKNAFDGFFPPSNRGMLKNAYHKLVPAVVKEKFRSIRQKSSFSYIPGDWLKQTDIQSYQELSDSRYNIKNLPIGQKALFNDFHYTSLPSNLNNFDRASMQSSVEIRMPFMDWRLVTFVFSLPITSKIGGGFTKKILRDCMKGIMPEEIRTRKLKIGLNAPITEWFNKNLNEFILDEINSSSFLNSDLWDGHKIKSFAEQRCKEKSWNPSDSALFWNYLNAHLIVKNNNSNTEKHTTSTVNYQQCTRCVLDTTAPHITFDENGVCKYCNDFDRAAKHTVFRDEKEKEKDLVKMIEEIKIAGKGKEYDCILGLSGGVDSTYLALLAKKYQLRPLTVHFDNGWNSELAVKNIENTVTKLGYDLFTYVVDWKEFNALQLSYLKASVVDIEVPTDHLIFATLHKLAYKKKIKYILSGLNDATEYTMPEGWNFFKTDLTNMLNIHKRFGKVTLKKFPKLGLYQKFFYQQMGVISIPMLNYVPYVKSEVKKVIQEELNWKDYGGKHFESVFTRFYQGYILPKKFNIDKRKAHLSNLIITNQITRQQALEELKLPTYPIEEQQADLEYVIKKFELTNKEFQDIMSSPPIDHIVYGSDYDPKNFRYYNYYTKISEPIFRLLSKI